MCVAFPTTTSARIRRYASGIPSGVTLFQSMSSIRPARRDELPALRAIESDAGSQFALVDMPAIAADEPPAIAVLEAYHRCGRAWVAVDSGDSPVAYLLSSSVDGAAHIDQLSVATASAHQRIGAGLIEHLARIAATEDLLMLTLTTFRDVPWNAPYYTRLGFSVIQPADYGPELRSLIAHEQSAIPSDAPRVAMRRKV